MMYFLVFITLISSLLSQEKVEAPESLLTIPSNIRYSKRPIPDRPPGWDGSTKLLFCGDVMFDWGIRETMDELGTVLPFEELGAMFSEADFRLVNLETPILEQPITGERQKSYVFSGKKSDLNVLNTLGVNAVFLGNNHTMDFGPVGLRNTMNALQESSIGFMGAGYTEKEANQPGKFSIKNTNYYIFSHSRVGSPHHFAQGNKLGAAYFSPSKVLDSVKQLGPEAKNGVSIASVHWGVEYSPEPEEVQRAEAKQLIDQGFSAVVGHHPHIPQGIEVYKNGIILYSLGNCVFGSRNAYLNHNLAAILHYREKKLLGVELIPLFGKFQKDKHYIYPLDPPEAEEFLWEIFTLSENLGTKIQIRNGRGYYSFL